MPFVLEDGTGVAGATSYATEDMADIYAEDRLLTAWTSVTVGKEEALIRATSAIDVKYRGRFPGYKTNLRAQSLEWPRAQAYDADDNLIPSDEIPIEIINATIEAAVRELAVPGSMMPDLARGGAIKRVKAGSVEVEYAGGSAEARTTFQLIDGVLSGILSGGSGGGLFGIAVRI